jgi:hypothetical protein
VHKNRNGCDGGTPWLVAHHLSSLGTVLESCDPYSPANQPCKAGCPYIKTVTEMWGLYGTNPPVESLKNWLRNYGPLYVTINAGHDDAWGQEFQQYDGSYTLYYAENNPQLNNHAVLLVGWDDSLPHQGGQGGWIVKNSWGTGWGGTCGYGTEPGFFTIAYSSAGVGNYPSVFRDWIDYDPDGALLYLDDDGYQAEYGYQGSMEAWSLVKLMPPHDGCAMTVEFWTTDATNDVDVYIYDSFDGHAPSGLLWKKENLRYDYAGYHHVVVDSTVSLHANNDVFVAVKFGNAEYFRAVAADTVGPAARNQSFVSRNGQAGTWTDLGAVSPPADVGIRLRMAPCGAEPTTTTTPEQATATMTKTSTPQPATATPTRTRTQGPSPTLGRNRLYVPLLLKGGGAAHPTATPTVSETEAPTEEPTERPTEWPTATSTPSGGWVTIKEETFEGEFPGEWLIESDGEAEWGKRDCRAAAGSFSGWAVGGAFFGDPLPCDSNYPDDLSSWMTYGPFSLEDATAGDVLFDYWVNSVRDSDVLNVGVSTDGRYFYGLYTSGNSGGWRHGRLDLTNVFMLGNVCGQPEVYLAFSFESDEDTNLPEGAYVDNIVLRKAAMEASAPQPMVSSPGMRPTTFTRRPAARSPKR